MPFTKPVEKTFDTAREINGQPDLWKQCQQLIRSHEESITTFLVENDIHPDNDQNIILTGAGTSGFIGQVAQYAFWEQGFCNARAVPTTDLVTHFNAIVDTTKPLLLISFGRSGNSPESEAVYDLANKYVSRIYHMVITCNPEGRLAEKAADSDNSYLLVLPQEAEDQGLAMTGSFTGMLLSILLIATIHQQSPKNSLISQLTQYGNIILHDYFDTLKQISQLDFKRIVFLGDGPNLGLAREAQLKVQELTDGLCIGKHDSFLGFRHGPKAVLDDETLLVYLMSNQLRVFRYQFDLVKQVSDQQLALHTLAVGNQSEVENHVDTTIELPVTSGLAEYWLPVPYILTAQLIGFFKSRSLDLNPDSPSRNNAISRVVEGVTIYPS